jgi:hypothetical protein
MLRTIIAFLMLSAPLTVVAGDMTFTDIMSQKGIRLSSGDLNQLLPNAKVVSYLDSSTRRWKHEPDGTFMAYSDARRSGKMMSTQAAAHGTWRIDENGAYCVTIDWPKKTEKWCKQIYKVNGKYYGVKPDAGEDAAAHEFEFSN